jgi:hypothetical protein
MRRWSFVAGALLIVLGVFALLQVALNAIGISFRIWAIFWPLVLIGLGAWIVMGFTRRGGASGVAHERATVPLEGAAEAAITIHHGAGRLMIGGAGADDQLLSGSFGGGLDASRRLESGRLMVNMRVRDRDFSRYFFGPWNHGWAGALDWDFQLNRGIPLSLHLETGASETRLSLLDLKVRELSLKTGASSTMVDLPTSAGFTRMTVESGAAAIRIHVPQGVAASIHVKSALAGIHVDTVRFPHSGGGYVSSDYAQAANKVEIFIETGVGSVDIS